MILLSLNWLLRLSQGTKGVFYGREPYVNDSSPHVTRFIGLANVGNKEKQHPPCPLLIFMRDLQMLLYHHMLLQQNLFLLKTLQSALLRALICNIGVMMLSGKGKEKLTGVDCVSNLHPQGPVLEGVNATLGMMRKPGSTVCFDFLNKGKCERGPECRFAHSLSEEAAVTDVKTRSDQRRVESSCWFCLSSPDVESHLVISIGDGYYCALAKGSLVPDHVLVIPVEHFPTTLMMPVEAEAELRRYKNALDKYFEKQGKATVYFEWVSQHSRHANLQIFDRKGRRMINQNSTGSLSPELPKIPHVDHQTIPITGAINHYSGHLHAAMQRLVEIPVNVMNLLCPYSEFRPVIGDGECFYRSFIFSYLEQVLDRQDTHEEHRLLAAVKGMAMQHAHLGWTSEYSRSHKMHKPVTAEELANMSAMQNQNS